MGRLATVGLRSLALSICIAALSLPAFGTSAISFDANQDHRPDLAVLHQSFTNRGVSEYSFEIHLAGTHRPAQVEVFSAAPGARLEHWDVDGDSDRDIVLMSPSGTPLRVWLNDGMGRFAPGKLSDCDCVQESSGPILVACLPHTFGLTRTTATAPFVLYRNPAGRVIRTVRVELAIVSAPRVFTRLPAELSNRPPPALA